MPFELSVAPYNFTTVMTAINYILEKLIASLNYLI